MTKENLFEINNLFDNSLRITHILGIRFTVEAVFKLMIDFEIFREDKTLKSLIIKHMSSSIIFAYTDLNDANVDEKYKALFEKVNISYMFNGYLHRHAEEILALNYNIKKCSFDSYRDEGTINMNNFREICARSFVCYETELYEIFENCLIPDKKWEKQLEEIQAYVLNDCQYYIHLESANYYELREKAGHPDAVDGIIFGFCKNTDKNIRDIILETVNEHLVLIATNNKEYYADCDEDFLRGEWRSSLIKFKMKLENFRRIH